MVELKIVKEESSDSQSDIARVVNAWKVLKGLPMEGQASKNWNAVHFRRNARSAKQLITLFDGWEGAVDCLQFVYEKLEDIGCTFTMETIVKHSDSYREHISRRRK